jgi:ribonuclease E
MHEAGADLGGQQAEPSEGEAPVEQAFNQGEEADEHQGAPQSASGDGEGPDGARRRRRRGRRGGRRHRRNGENGGQHADREQNGGGTPYSAQSDAGSFGANEPQPHAHAEPERPAPAPSEPAEAQPTASQQRRGSSVREPASFSRPPADAPPSAPVVSSTGGEEPASPKRGWWGRKLLGDK